ncbi:MAG: Gfo/Idh/MocA family oxidoreductase, partial [Verrucomicrobia bacterium]|nr:Gfo/Idh/MocA family oxidoreductase [Verrucomicrobiota bacterium]
MNRANLAPKSTRRQFIKQTSSLAAGASVLSGVLPHVHAADDPTIRLALIGCGGRGTGAVGDALGVQNYGPIKLYAMADVVEARLGKVRDSLKQKFGEKIAVADDRMFLGFDAYKKAIDILRPGDIAMCTTRAYIRPVHVEYAVKKGINVFMEKPFASDPGSLHRLLRAGELAEKKGVKIAAGLQCRHSPARQALIQQVRDGVLGDIPLIRANRLGGAGWLTPQGEKSNNFMEQLQFGRIHLYWIGSGHMVDYLIHQIDECCWIKDAWPVSAIGMAGRVANSKDCGQNLDNYSIEYTFADGTKAFCGFYRINKARSDFA